MSTPPEEILRCFMAEMNAWEKRCLKRDDECIAAARPLKDGQAAAAAEYKDIFQRYCSPTRAVPRDSVYYGNPPEYDPENEPVLEIIHSASDVVMIRTQQNYAFKERNRYTLVLEEGGWRLAEKKIESVAEPGRLLDGSL